MWYRTRHEIYFLLEAGEPYQDPIVPPPPSHKIGHREFKIGDTESYRFNYHDDVHGNNYTFKFMIESGPTLMETSMKGYPEHPNYINLREFIQKTQKGPVGSILLGDAIVLSTQDTTVTVSVRGNFAISWSETGTTYFIPDPTDPSIIDQYKLFGDKGFEYRKEDGYWQIKSPNCDWLPLYSYLQFTPNHSPIGLEKTNKVLVDYQRALGVIKNYVAGISMEAVVNSVGNAKVGSVVASRCFGCGMSSKTHFRVHMQRKELPFYMIFATFKETGSGMSPLPETWDLIVACKAHNEQALEGFKSKLRTFLVMSVIDTVMLLDVPKSKVPLASIPSEKYWSPKKSLQSLKKLKFESPLPAMPDFTQEAELPLQEGGPVHAETHNWATYQPLEFKTAVHQSTITVPDFDEFIETGDDE